MLSHTHRRVLKGCHLETSDSNIARHRDSNAKQCLCNLEAELKHRSFQLVPWIAVHSMI